MRWGEGAEETAKNLKLGKNARVPVATTVPGEGKKAVEVTVTRPKTETVGPEARDVKASDDGSLPSIDTTVTNLGGLSEGIKIRWGEGAEEIARNLKPGESAKVPVIITVPGEDEKTVEITITHLAIATNNPQTNANDNNEDRIHNISRVTTGKLSQIGENSATLSALGATLVGIAGLGLFSRKEKED